MSAAHDFADDQWPGDAHAAAVVGEPSPPEPRCDPTPNLDAAQADLLADDQSTPDAHDRAVVGEPSPPEPRLPATPSEGAAQADLLADDQVPRDAQRPTVVGEPSPPEPMPTATPMRDAAQADALLLVLSDALSDIEATRIANQNRLRSLDQAKGLACSQAAVQLGGLVDALTTIEHGAALALRREMRKHPLGPWIKATIGVGEKQGARLLASIGDPYWHSQHDRPRTVSELWAYCGYHVLSIGHRRDATQTTTADALHPGHSASDAHEFHAGVDPSSNPGQATADAHASTAGVAPSRRKGIKSNWNADAKMRAYLVAESCIKQRTSPYRVTYDNGRTKYADAVHAAPCRRCGPTGKPAPEGSPLSLGHQHARAMRLVAKEILKDLWRESRALRGGEVDDS